MRTDIRPPLSQEGMELRDIKLKTVLFDKVGLYIVAPEYLLTSHPNVHRCGAAGTKHARWEAAAVDASGQFEKSGYGTLFGRMMMYDANWFTGGKIFYFLQLERRSVASAQNPSNQVEATNEDRKNMVQYYEKEFHKNLEFLEVSVAKPKEWFKGDLALKKMALQMLAYKNSNIKLYKFYKDHVSLQKDRVQGYYQQYVKPQKFTIYTPKTKMTRQHKRILEEARQTRSSKSRFRQVSL